MSEQSEIPQKETLPAVPKNRILIFGSGGSGIFEMQKDFKEYLIKRGIPDPHIQTAKHMENIEPAIFNTFDIPESEEERKKNLPKGIIVLPTIKQNIDGLDFPVDTYSAKLGNGQTISGYIKSICDKYQVPVIFLRKDYSREKTEKEINRLLKLNK